jgi:membrane protein YqaA with SNARE-associated domain
MVSVAVETLPVVFASGPAILGSGSTFLSGITGAIFGGLRTVVETATGPAALIIIAVYSFLIAFVLPAPSEVVLVPASSLNLGVSYEANLVLIMLVSGAGKALGSLFAFHIGQEAKEYGPLIRRIKRSRFDVIEWSEKKTIQLAQDYGYIGLAMALSVPFFPDTLSIYAFTVLEEDYLRFGLATFAGSVGRLLVTIGLAAGTVAII